MRFDFQEKGIDNAPACGYNYKVRGSAGIGRQARLRGVCASVWVQVPSAAPTKTTTQQGGCFLLPLNQRGLEAAAAAFRGGKNAVVSAFLAAGFASKDRQRRVWLRAKRSHLPHQQKQPPNRAVVFCCARMKKNQDAIFTKNTVIIFVIRTGTCHEKQLVCYVQAAKKIKQKTVENRIMHIDEYRFITYNHIKHLPIDWKRKRNF